MRPCGGCGQSGLQLLFNLGDIPLVNAFVGESIVERAYPLALCFCPTCGLLQLRDCIPPDRLFSHYLHLSSASEANLRHLMDVKDFLRSREGESLKREKVLEIGCNDGSLLSLLKPEALSVLGVDPAANLASHARERGVSVVTDFFLEPVGQRLKEDTGGFDWVVALNVVAHTSNFVSLLRGVRHALAPGGTFLMENTYVPETLMAGQFDGIYHEHVYYFSVHSLKAAFERAGLFMLDAEKIPTQGGSIRALGCVGQAGAMPSSRVTALLQEEKIKGLDQATSYQGLERRNQSFSQDLTARLRAYRAQVGRPSIGLGAPARGMVILNYCRIGPDLVNVLVDDTPLKQGKRCPGMHIPVASWEILDDGNSREADQTFLLLSWNYEKDMIARLRARGCRGRVLVPFPEMKEISLD